MAKHHYTWDKLAQAIAGTGYSTAHGGTLTGETIEVGRYRYPAGTGAKPHSHPNEQMMSIIQGRLRYRIGDEEGIAEAGDVLYMPAGIEHETEAIDGDVVMISSKNLVDGRTW